MYITNLAYTLSLFMYITNDILCISLIGRVKGILYHYIYRYFRIHFVIMYITNLAYTLSLCILLTIYCVYR